MYVKEIKGRNVNAEKCLRAQRDFSLNLSGLCEPSRKHSKAGVGKDGVGCPPYPTDPQYRIRALCGPTLARGRCVTVLEVQRLPEFSLVISMVTTGPRTHNLLQAETLSQLCGSA